MNVDSWKPGNVSRETLERLEAFHDLVLKWTQKINLVSKSSVPYLWDRHIWDSAQLLDIGPQTRTWTDLGSGGGFPGLVIAILSVDTAPARQVTLIESDKRKCAFLREAVRTLSLNAQVIAERIETAPPQNSGVLSARALSDLATLLEFAQYHLSPDGVALFPKGASWEKEVEAARESWCFDLKVHRSQTDSQAAILEVKEIARA